MSFACQEELPTIESGVDPESAYVPQLLHPRRTLVLFALISAGMSLVPSSFQPGLPANGSLWRTVSSFLLLVGLAWRSSAS